MVQWISVLFTRTIMYVINVNQGIILIKHVNLIKKFNFVRNILEILEIFVINVHCNIFLLLN